MGMADLVPAPYRLIARLLAIVALLLAVYAIGRSHGAGHVRQAWDAAIARQNSADLALQQSYRARERALVERLNQAEIAAHEREVHHHAAALAAGAAAGQLRDELAAARGRLPTAPAEACRATAGAALELLGACAEEYRAVAAAADGHASDARTLSDAWPD